MDADIPEPPLRRFSFDPKVHYISPVWSPDGKFVYYAKLQGNAVGLFRKDAAGVQSEEKVLETEAGRIVAPLDMSPDGKWLLFQKDGGPSASLWTLSLADGKQARYSPEKERAAAGRISPDGKWVAYASGRAGLLQVQVASFPSHEVLFQPTTIGGNFPQWRRDGKELFFETGPERLMAISVESSGGSLKFGLPQPLLISTSGSLTTQGQPLFMHLPPRANASCSRVQPQPGPRKPESCP
jgi:eukaryotic-like serine/threonine-protein kinase